MTRNSVSVPDNEAIEVWRGLGVPDERIVLLGRDDNFWQSGPTGPCGPCSELYLDRGPDFGPDTDRPGDDTERFLEYWNLVFMQYELQADGSLPELPTKNIDTGLGVERMASVLQGVPSVYETDLFSPLIALGEELSGKKYADDFATTRALRIIADHGRGATFLLADGVVPSNEDRGYILRRIMRRAIQQGHVLGIDQPFLVRVYERVRETMKDAYPEVEREWATIERWARAEEESFSRTLEQGERLLDELIEKAKADSTSWVSAEEAFRLHDTYGFPYEMTKELLAEEGLAVDDQGFEELMERAREASRAGSSRTRARAEAGGDVHVEHEDVLRFAREAGFQTRFVGYETTEADTVLRVAERRQRLGARQARGEPLLPGGRRPGLGQRPRRDALGPRAGGGRLPRWATTRRWRSSRSRARSARARRRARVVERERAARDHAQPHRHPPAARGAARAARRPRAPGGLLRGAGQAALRLHPRRAAVARGACRGRAARGRLGRLATTPCARSRRRATRPSASARWRCSARSTATGCGWSRSRTSRASCAAARTCRRRPRSGSST